MMNNKIQKTVALILDRSNGHTTVSDVTVQAINRLLAEKPIDQWFSMADMLMLFKMHVSKEVTRQFKSSFDSKPFPNLQAVSVQLKLDKVTSWMALGDGSKATWVKTVIASQSEWGLNYQLKRHHRQLTQKVEGIPLAIMEFLKSRNAKSLSEV